MAVFHGDTPTMAAANYSNSTYAGAQMLGAASFISNSARASEPSDWTAAEALNEFRALEPCRRVIVKPTPNEEESPMPARRIVQVYIADPSDAVPLADSVLYTGDQKMTDLTDQELFFEIDIKSILEAHNAKRAKIIDKKIKDRTEYLEAVKVRDLKMVVVNVASF